MPKKQLIVANDVREAARSGGFVIYLRDKAAIVTSEARGVAKDLRVELKLEEPPRPPIVAAAQREPDEAAVRRAVVAQMGEQASDAVVGEVMRRVVQERAKSQQRGIRRIASLSEGVSAQGGKAGANVSQIDLEALLEGGPPPRATGFMAWTDRFFPFTREGDEVTVVLDGELQFRVGQEVIAAHAGDVMLTPGGTRADVGTTSTVRLFYLSYGA